MHVTEVDMLPKIPLILAVYMSCNDTCFHSYIKVLFRHYNLITGDLTVSKQLAVTADNRFFKYEYVFSTR